MKKKRLTRSPFFNFFPPKVNLHQGFLKGNKSVQMQLRPKSCKKNFSSPKTNVHPLIINAHGFLETKTPECQFFFPISLPFPSGGTTSKTKPAHLLGATGHTEAIVQITSLWKPMHNTNPNTYVFYTMYQTPYLP